MKNYFEIHRSFTILFQVISEHGEHCSHFDLKIGPAPKVQKVQKTKEQAKAEEEADEAFKKRMARM